MEVSGVRRSMENKNKVFDRAVSSLRSAALRRVRRTGNVSAVDVASVVPTLKGAGRGAAVREAFRRLEDEKIVRRSDDTVYHTATRHRVSIYTAI